MTLTYQVIDATAEGWSFYPEHNVITSFTIDKKWTKSKIIDFYNNSLKNFDGIELYTVKSLSNKKLSTIIEEICCLASKP
ncbi:hypothetical Protein YC6258_01319 [Gynuella sunshinyii YC6258]|uniref:Uncharacterized protein n=1 Tax=Gynuella sunshinyii YC6258 TaxID=1445510 RepID=A0A0C5VFM7_9GAMM|nr:hypothetical Protein YC6258_01319 [Gynuella sunshinyii YC6258]